MKDSIFYDIARGDDWIPIETAVEQLLLDDSETFHFVRRKLIRGETGNTPWIRLENLRLNWFVLRGRSYLVYECLFMGDWIQVSAKLFYQDYKAFREKLYLEAIAAGEIKRLAREDV